MKMENDDDRLILISAFRYALGRMTYMPSVICAEIKRQWPYLSEGDKALFQREVKEAIDRDLAGMDIDQRVWAELLELPST